MDCVNGTSHMFKIRCATVSHTDNFIAGFAICQGDNPDDAITVISDSVIILLYMNIIAIKVTKGIIIDIMNGIISDVI